MDKNKYYSVTETAQLLGISRAAVLKKIKTGRIKAERVGHIFVIPKKELGIILGETISEKQKKLIEAGVKKTIQEYGETLEKLGQE